MALSQDLSARLQAIKDMLDRAISSAVSLSPQDLSSVLKSVAEAGKAEIEAGNAFRISRSEQLRFWIPVLAPILTAAALVATLLFQVAQFRENARQVRETTEDTQWRETLNRAKETRGPEGAFAFTLIKSFLDSKRYGMAAREISLTILAHTGDSDTFSALSPAIMARTNWSNVHEIANLSRRLGNFSADVPERIKQQRQSRQQMLALVRQGRLPPGMMADAIGKGAAELDDPDRLVQEIDEELQTVSDAVVEFLRNPNIPSRPSKLTLTLIGIHFRDADLSNVNFGDALLAGADCLRCDMTGADLSNVSAENSTWPETAWWRAKRVHPSLLEHLRKAWAFKVGTKYFNDKIATSGEYERAVKELGERNQK